MPESSSAFHDLCNELCGPVDSSVDRRTDSRCPRSLSALIEPLDGDFQRCGDPFFVTSRDITEQGMGFVNPVKLENEYVRVALVDHNASLIGRVCHNTNVGSAFPVYLIGIQFLGVDHD